MNKFSASRTRFALALETKKRNSTRSKTRRSLAVKALLHLAQVARSRKSLILSVKSTTRRDKTSSKIKTPRLGAKVLVVVESPAGLVDAEAAVALLLKSRRDLVR